jgi:UDP-N-acetylglucosamine--N-acetylmuramyl-(pentapeptide) pyrophosphoryl-undecaprenol N-acetylglucosamine transferase
VELAPEATVRFLCSSRPIDALILDESGFDYLPLPMTGFSFRPSQLPNSLRSFVKSRRIAARTISESEHPVVIGIGGFASGPSCLAAHKLGVPIAMLNVDIIPGRANRIVARWADEIFVQFEDTRKYFARSKARISVVGCPLRKAFDDMNPGEAIKQLGLEKGKKVLLITGASSGAANINDAMVRLLDELEQFAGGWQIVHLAGLRNFEEIERRYASAKVSHKVLAYCNDMAALLSCAHLVIGRSGAVSIAEYAAAGVPSICMPYPYHKDRHQYLNAAKLVEAGAAVIVNDVDDSARRAERLWEELERLMKDESKLLEMVENCGEIANLNAASSVAHRLLEDYNG